MGSSISNWTRARASSQHLERLMEVQVEQDAVRYFTGTRNFQRWLDSAVQGIHGIYTAADDILVIGKGLGLEN